ncbi:MAG: hypothetical protein ABSD51_10205 [Candidatus Binatus sp.]
MVTFDATILLLLLAPNVPAPTDPATGKPVECCRERIEFLIEDLENKKTTIIIPTPALSEVLVRAETAAPEYLNLLKQSSAFKIEAFDERAAVEVAHMTREALKLKRHANTKEAWAKAKFDRQIVAIAKVNGSTVIYSDDHGVRALGQSHQMTVIGIAQLPLPPVIGQTQMFTTEETTHGKQAVLPKPK